MYQLYIKQQNAFSESLKGEYEEFEDAKNAALSAKAKDQTIKYRIEETDGSVDSYGNLLVYEVEKG